MSSADDDPRLLPAGPGVPLKLACAAAALAALAGAALGGVAHLPPEVAAALGGAAGAALGAGALGALLVTRPVGRIMEAALAMAKGRLDERAPADGADEVARLGASLNHLARALDRTVTDLRAERDLLAGILDGMGEGVLVLDAHESVVLANRALRAMARIGEDAAGKPLLEAIRNAALKEALDASAEAEDAVVREIELGWPMPRKLLVRVSRLARRGEERGTIAVFHDVTDLRRLETIRTDFVANVSHELRTPITAISTSAETLLGGALADPEAASEFVEVIARHATRLRQLVDDLLDLSKLEAKGYRLSLTDLDLPALLPRAVDLVEAAARRRRVTIAIDAPPGPIPHARADRKALEQVILNLLDNAIKYAGEGAHVTLRARAADDGRVEVSVADDGVGIPPAHLGRLFERFYRVDPGRSRELGGTGLGLAIVKHLVELMGGSIDVESEPGKGACFTVRLLAA